MTVDTLGIDATHVAPTLAVHSDTPINVLVVEDHRMVAEMLTSTLDGYSDIAVVGCVGTADEAMSLLSRISVDVVLMDFRLPDGSGIDAARDIQAQYPEARVVMVTGAGTDAVLSDALEAGCVGYVSKSESVASLAGAVRGAHAGVTAVSPEAVARLMASVEGGGSSRAASTGGLTERELDVLGLLAEGLPSSELAERLSIKPNTVRNHVQSVLEKLEAHSRLEAVATGIRMGLIGVVRQ